MATGEAGVHRLSRFEDLLHKVATRSEENLKALYSSSCRSCSAPRERNHSTDEWESCTDSGSKTLDDASIVTSSSNHGGCNHIVQGILEKMQKRNQKKTKDPKEEKIQRLEAFNAELQSVVESLAQEKNLTRREAKQELERTVTTFYAQKDLLRKQCDAAELLNQHLEAENGRLRKELKAIKSIVEESDLWAMEREMIGIEVPRQIADLQREIEDLKTKLESEQKLKLAYQSETKALAKALNNIPRIFVDQTSDFSIPSDEGASEMLQSFPRDSIALTSLIGQAHDHCSKDLPNQQKLEESEKTIAKLREQCESFQREIEDLKKKDERRKHLAETNKITWAVDCNGSSFILSEELEEARCIIRELQDELEETIERNDQEVAILENTIQIVQAEENEKDREIQTLKKVVRDLTKKLDSMEHRLDTVEHTEHLELLKEHKRRISSRAPERPSESLRYDDEDSTISTVIKEIDSFELQSGLPFDEHNCGFEKDETRSTKRRTQQPERHDRNHHRSNQKKTATDRKEKADAVTNCVESLHASSGSSESFRRILNTKADLTFETTSTVPSSMDSPRRQNKEDMVDESNPTNRNENCRSIGNDSPSDVRSPGESDAISSLVKEIKSQDFLIKNLQEQICFTQNKTKSRKSRESVDLLRDETSLVTAHMMEMQEKIQFLTQQVFESNQRIAGLEKELKEKK